jgi:hypothetical protein
MNYKRIHDEIIENRIKYSLEKASGKTETHHIVPKSLGGSDSKENLIELLSREHFLVHFCLWKMYPKGSVERAKMVKAFTMMKAPPTPGGTRYINSRLYAAAQIEKSKAMSVAQGGERNSQFGSMWIFWYDPKDPTNMENRKEKKISKGSEIPIGWHPGRKMKIFKICKSPKCNNIFDKRAGGKKQYCSPECRKKDNPSMVEKNREAFIAEFKKTGVMGHSLKVAGVALGAVGGHAVIARRILEEEGLIHLLKDNKLA